MPRVLRSQREIRMMRRAGLLVWQAHQTAGLLVRPGVTTAELDQAIADVFRSAAATPLFLGYGAPHPFPAATCISINEQIVHGIPGGRQLQEGDIVSLDTGCQLAGWCGDAACTHPVGQISSQAQLLLQTTGAVLDLAIDLMAHTDRWSEVARHMQAFVEQAGLSVVEEMVGHGIGRQMHEPPQVPNYYHPRWAEHEDFQLRPGLVLAIEPMVNAGSKSTRLLDDHWTLVTADGKWSAHFEHTVAITHEGPRRLTGPPEDNELESIPRELVAARDRWVHW